MESMSSVMITNDHAFRVEQLFGETLPGFCLW